MHNLFSLPRFIRLFSKHTAEHWKSYLMGAGVLAGVMLLMMSVVTYVLGESINLKQQAAFFVVFLLGGGFLFTSSVFADFGEKSRAIAALSLPASHLEKYTVAWLYSYLLFSVAYTGIFYLVDSVVVSFSHEEGPQMGLINIFSPEYEVYISFGLYAMLHGIALWGSIFFEKLQFIKTAILFLLVLLGLTIVNFQVVERMLGQDLRSALPFMSANFIEKSEFYRVEFPEDQRYWLGVALLLFALLFWLASYTRLREKQL